MKNVLQKICTKFVDAQRGESSTAKQFRKVLKKGGDIRPGT